MDQSIALTYKNHAAAAVKRMYQLVLLTALIGFGLYSLVIAPLYTQLSANITYQEAAITYVLYYALSAVEIAVFFIVFPATIYAVWRGGLLGSRAVWITFSLATIGKYVLNFFMDCLTDGHIPSWQSFVDKDVPIILPNFLLELGQYVLILFMAVLIIRGRKRKWQTDVLLDGPKAGDERSLAFPVTKLFSLKNPVLASSFATSVFLFVARAISHLIYQLALLIYNGESDGTMILVIDLVSDLLLAAIAYFVMALLLSSFDKREMRDLADEAQGSST